MATVQNGLASFRLATYNLQKMVDGIPNRDGLKEERKSDESVAAVAQVIDDSESDVISLQEVENLHSLEALRGHGDLKARYPYVVLVDGNDQRKGFDVALMSRYPITGYTSHRDKVIGRDSGEVQHFSRDLLQVELALPQEKTLRVFCTHFVAQGNEWCDRKRLREAEATAEIVEQVTREESTDFTAVLGDFNDRDGSEVLEVLEADASLVNSSENLPPSWGAAKPHEKYRPSRLDHILVGDSLAKTLRGRGVQEHPADAIASDHRLVFADFELVA